MMTQIDPSNTVSRAYSMVRNDFATLVPLALIFSLPSSMIYFLDANPFDAYAEPAVVPFQFISFFAGVILMASIAHFVFRRTRGESADLGESIQMGLGRTLPVIGASILCALAVTVGLLLLIVPGLILLVALSIFVPIVVIERAGPLQALKRSAQLTEGNRWRVLATGILAVLPMMVLMMIPSMALAVCIASGVEIPRSAVIGYGAFNLFLTAIITPIVGAVDVLLYHDLRVIKDGGQDFPRATVA